MLCLAVIWYLQSFNECRLERAPQTTERNPFPDLWPQAGALTNTAQWSEGLTKPPWSSKQIGENLSFLEAFGYILCRKVFLNIFKAWKTHLKNKKMLKNKEIWN